MSAILYVHDVQSIEIIEVERVDPAHRCGHDMTKIMIKSADGEAIELCLFQEGFEMGGRSLISRRKMRENMMNGVLIGDVEVVS